MYRRPKFLELLIQIREEMAREADFDVDLFVEQIRSGKVDRFSRTFTLADPPAAQKTHRKKSKTPTRSKSRA